MSSEINLRTAKSGDTLIGLIREKLTEENGGKRVNVNSVWGEILDVVDEQQQETQDVYSGGSERKNWGRNYVIFVGQTIKFSQTMWNKIKTLVGLSSQLDSRSVDDTSETKQQDFAVPNEIDLTQENSNVRKFLNNNGTEKFVVRVQSENVRYSSMDIEYNSEGKLIGYIQHFPEGDMSFDANHNLLPNGKHAVQTFRNEEQQEKYKTALNDAKTILLDNASELGLTDEEIALINKIDVESIDFGAARFDSKRNCLLFNMNDQNVPNKNEFVKVIIHELTHATQGNPERNTQREERMCETRAIKCALKLIQSKKMETFMLPNGIGHPGVDITTLTTDEKINNYVNTWIVQQEYDRRLPVS